MVDPRASGDHLLREWPHEWRYRFVPYDMVALRWNVSLEDFHVVLLSVAKRGDVFTVKAKGSRSFGLFGVAPWFEGAAFSDMNTRWSLCAAVHSGRRVFVFVVMMVGRDCGAGSGLDGVYKRAPSIVGLVRWRFARHGRRWRCGAALRPSRAWRSPRRRLSSLNDARGYHLESPKSQSFRTVPLSAASHLWRHMIHAMPCYSLRDATSEGRVQTTAKAFAPLLKRFHSPLRTASTQMGSPPLHPAQVGSPST